MPFQCGDLVRLRPDRIGGMWFWGNDVFRMGIVLDYDSPLHRVRIRANGWERWWNTDHICHESPVDALARLDRP